jgi:Protein kinase domain
MSVEPSELTSEVWTRLQGHVVNGVFPLGRSLGGSDHSGVFLTRSAGHAADVAIKLVPTNRALAESQLPRWKRAGGLTHPHLLRLLEWGGCQLEGLPYLYSVMEYADQTLAQLLLHRPMTDAEAQEMLPPILDALAFLHGRDLVQGQLKPANVLVVGDQVKLASDTIRRFSEGPLNSSGPTAYDPPEARQGGSSAAGDVWALGVTLFEALTRRRPSGLSEPRGATLPADFSPAFRDVVAGCLVPRPEDRLSVPEFGACVRALSAGTGLVASTEPAALVPPEPPPSEPSPPELRTPEPAPLEAATLQIASEPALPQAATLQIVAPGVAQSTPSATQARKAAGLLTVMIGAVVLLALGWTGVRVLTTHRTPSPPAVQIAEGSRPQTPGSSPAAGEVRAPGPSDVVTPPSAPHQVIPDVPQSARRSIRGHIKVWVRVIVDERGSVLAAVADRTGPSAYFQRLAIEAAKKWTFPAVETPSRRMMQVRFDFGRDATTAHAVILH